MHKIFIVLLLPLLAFATPSWFFNIKGVNNDIIGYGVNSSLSQAKQDALADVTNAISVNVESNINTSTEDNNGQARSNSSVDSHTSSRAVLSGVEFIKVKQEAGLWYVAAKYDNSPIELKIKKKLKHVSENEKQNKYLKNTPLFLSLNNEVKFKLNYQLIRKDNLWQLRYKHLLFNLDQHSFYKLFSNQNSKTISIKPNKSVYNVNDKMYFALKHSKPGYISILYVEHNGKVGVLLANYFSKKPFIYPGEGDELAFKITNPYGEPISELYIALYSHKRINLAEFEGVGESHLDESNYNFDKLCKLFERYPYSTSKIKIH